MGDWEKIKEKSLKEKEDQEFYQKMLNVWINHKPFETVDDIGLIPKVSKEDYEKIIIPNIIRCGGIPKKDLIVGQTYIGDCRNSSEATWNGKTFDYKRCKFGMWFDDEINHFEDDDGHDLFVPIKKK